MSWAWAWTIVAAVLTLALGLLYISAWGNGYETGWELAEQTCDQYGPRKKRPATTKLASHRLDLLLKFLMVLGAVLWVLTPAAFIYKCWNERQMTHAYRGIEAAILLGVSRGFPKP